MEKTTKDMEIKSTNILIIQGQEFHMSVDDLKKLRDVIDKVIGEKPAKPVFFPERKEPEESDYPGKKVFPPYKPWRTEDEIYPEKYPKIWMNDDTKPKSRDKITVTL